MIKDQNGKLIWKEGFYLGKTTNNVAEYQAVIKALEWLIENQSTINNPRPRLGSAEGGQQITINFYIDSLLVVNQLNGVFKIKNSNLAGLILKIKAFENQLAADIFYKHILRDKNEEADKIVNDTLDKISLSGKMNNRDCNAHNFKKTPRFDI